MKKFIFAEVFILILLISFNCAEKNENEIPGQTRMELRRDAVQFMESLKSVLVKEMQTNGIASAVSVCSDTAQFLTRSYGAKNGIHIKRVSFKNRNPLNIPDEFESSGLEYFEKLKDQGTLNDTTDLIEFFEEDEVKSVRYLKPIIVQAPCLSCHGESENITEEVKLILNARYPDDRATGYQLNDLRGAVSVRKKIL